MTDPRLQSRRWRKLRAAVLERDGHRCHWCGGPANEADHLVARADGGTDTLDNLVAACRRHNAQRGGRDGARRRAARARLESSGAHPFFFTAPPTTPRLSPLSPRPAETRTVSSQSLGGPDGP